MLKMNVYGATGGVSVPIGCPAALMDNVAPAAPSRTLSQPLAWNERTCPGCKTPSNAGEDCAELVVDTATQQGWVAETVTVKDLCGTDQVALVALERTLVKAGLLIALAGLRVTLVWVLAVGDPVR